VARFLSGIAILGSLYGCSLLGDDKPAVSGVWGGDQIEFAATSGGLTLTYNCFVVTFPGAAHFIHGDSIVADGNVTAASFDPQIGQQWRISGTIVGDTAYISSSYLRLHTTDEWIGPLTDTLRAGHGVFYGLPCSE
jgi:hypothetical protein